MGLDPGITSAVFRVINTSPRPEASKASLVQEELIVPLGSIAGRAPHIVYAGDALLRAPGAGEDIYFAKNRDFYHDKISRSHFTVDLDDHGQPRIRDLGSAHGTSMLSGGSDGEVPLTPGFSYLLEKRNRIQLAGDRERSYEFVGLRVGAYIRLSRCLYNNPDLQDSQYWEWMQIQPGQRWHSGEIVDAHGAQLHADGNFQVSVEPGEDMRGNRVYRALVDYPASGGRPRRIFEQGPGSRLYATDYGVLSDNPKVEGYRAAYQLMIPGESDVKTKGSTLRFLRPNYLQVLAKIDRQGWPREVLIGFNFFERKPVHQARLVFNAANGGVASGKSWRHALVRALIEARRNDVRAFGVEHAWINEEHVKKYLSKNVSAGFSNNVTKWKSDITKMVCEGVRDYQAMSPKNLALPNEVDWSDIVEVDTSGPERRLRFNVGIELFVEECD